jgi:PPOX class probable F420-dependent enzyme
MANTMLTDSATRELSRAAKVWIPESHRDLIDGPYWAALTTVMPDGQPQVTPVWCDREGAFVLTNTMRGFRKEKNMRANPHVTLLVYDPRNPGRNIEVRGLVVELAEDGAIEHNDRLAQLYLGQPGAHFFGDSVPAELAQTYVPIKVTIAPTRVRLSDPVPSASLGASSGLPPSQWLGEEAGAAALPIVTPLPAPGVASSPVPFVPLPESHCDLFNRPVPGILSTIMPGGQPQSSLVWVDYDGTYVLLNTALGRCKCRNMETNPKVTLLVVDPNNTSRWIEVRGRAAEITTEGAIDHADMLAQRYESKAHFYGGVYKSEWQQYETRVIVKIMPIKVSLDAKFR